MNHPQRQYCDIGYSFLIGGDGNVYEGRGWDRVGSHTIGPKPEEFNFNQKVRSWERGLHLSGKGL
jgi:hypothetical protein